MKVKKGKKNQDSVNKFLQLHNFALGKKAMLPYEYTNGQFKNQFRSNSK